MQNLKAPEEKHWLFGNGWYLRSDPFTYLPFFAKKYGDIYRMKTLRFPIVVVNHPRLVKQILLERWNEFEKSFGYEVLSYLLGDGLLTSDGAKWKKQRKMLQPAFHRERIKNLVDVMAQEALGLEEEWNQKASSGEVSIDLSENMNRITLEIISRTMFSADVEPIVNEVSRTVTYLNEDAIHRIMHPLRPPMWVPTERNRKSKKYLARMNEILFGLIDKRKEQEQNSDCLLGMLLEAQSEDEEGVSRQQLRDEAMTIFIAGHETTAVAMGYVFFVLSGKEEKKNRLREEVLAVRPEGPIQFEDLNKLVYTKQVIEESMRLYPPVWILGRRNVKPLEFEGHQIDKKINFLIPIWHLHRDPDVWENPEEFNPDRFRPEIRNSIDRFSYMPFGGGPRTFIGNHFAMMEMQIILASLIRKHDFKVPENYNVELQAQMTLRPKKPIPLKLRQL